MVGDIMRLLNYVKIFYGITRLELLELDKNDLILVNNKKEKLTYKLKESDIVTVNGKIIEKYPFSYYMYNKPKGILSMISNNSDSYINNINIDKKLMVAGRLDKDSEGLLLLSNDPEFINSIMGEKSIIEKEYIVTTFNKINTEFINKMNGEFIIRGHLLKPVKIKIIDDYNFSIILTEGIYHQIRKMVIESGNRVKNLKRIRIGKYKLNDLKTSSIIEIKP